MLTIALASPFSASYATDLSGTYAIGARQVSIGSVRFQDFSNLLVGKFCLVMAQAKRKPILGGCVSQIIGIRAKKQMIWVTALPIIARMANELIIGYRAFYQMVHKAVGSPHDRFMHDKTISIASMRSLPFPAARGCLNDTLLQALQCWPYAGFMALFNSPSPISHVMIAAQPATRHRLSANRAFCHSFAPKSECLSQMHSKLRGG